MSDNWIHDCERAEEGFARREAQRRGFMSCTRGRHSWSPASHGGSCRCCGETIGWDEL